MLIDLETDEGEKTNVISKHPDVVAMLKKEAERARAEIGDVKVVGSDQRPHNLINPNAKD